MNCLSLASYSKKVFRDLKDIISIHIRDILIRNNVYSTNEHVRLTGEFADCFRPARGIKE